MKKKFVIILLNAIIATQLICCDSKQSEMFYINNTNDSISVINTKVCGQTIKVEALAAGDIKSANFLSKYDSSYDIEVIFTSGKKLKQKVGYVTNGICFRDTIHILQDSLMFKSKAITCNSH